LLFVFFFLKFFPALLNNDSNLRDSVCQYSANSLSAGPSFIKIYIFIRISLRTIKELGFDIAEAYIQKAEAAYRNFYDIKRRHLLFDRNYPDIISLTDLEPEFFSLWLFKRPMLTDEMVKNHLDQIPILNKVPNSPHPEYGTTAPICVRVTKDAKGFSYMSKDYQPFEKFGEENYSDGKADGFYYNGGSWFRPEYCAYVVGLKHGWKNAKLG